MNQKIIGLDLDGVILDHTQNRLAVSRKFGYRLDLADTPSDIFSKKISRDSYPKIAKILYDEPGVALKVPLMTGAKKGLGFLRQSPHFRYYLISRRNSVDSALKILKKYKLWPDYLGPHNVFFVKEKEDKNIKARELGIDYYLDDQPSVLNVLSSVRNKFLLDPLGVYSGAYSQNGHKSYKIVSSWPEFLTHLV